MARPALLQSSLSGKEAGSSCMISACFICADSLSMRFNRFWEVGVITPFRFQGVLFSLHPFPLVPL